MESWFNVVNIVNDPSSDIKIIKRENKMEIAKLHSSALQKLQFIYFSINIW